jgi:hypothetical protein
MSFYGESVALLYSTALGLECARMNPAGFTACALNAAHKKERPENPGVGLGQPRSEHPEALTAGRGVPN